MTALRVLGDALGAEAGAIWAAPQAGDELVLLALRGLGPTAVAPQITVGQGLAGRAVAEARAVQGASGMRVAGLAGESVVRHEVHVPLRRSGEVLGVAALGLLGDPPPPDAIERAQELADAAAAEFAALRGTDGGPESRLAGALLAATPDAAALLGADGDLLAENAPMALLRAAGVDALDAGGPELSAEFRDEVSGAEPGSRLARLVVPVADGRLVLLRDLTGERESERLKDEVLSLVSHELRTPLTSVVGYLELVLDGPDELPPKTQGFLEIVERNAQRLLRLVGDLLFVAQAEAGRMQMARTEVDLGAIASDAVEAARPQATLAGTTIELVGEPVRTFTGDRDRCAQVLDNLIANALKFGGEHGRIRVAVAERGEEAVLEVTDEGPGIPEADQQRIFERFARASNATEAAVPGAGLGLTVVRTIVEAHGGSVAVRSAPGQGTTMRVALPLD